MIGSPENNFQTMQPTQPRNMMLANALGNPNTQTPSMQGMSPQGMLSPNQYGQPTTPMPSYVKPQSNASFNMQPQIPNMNQAPQAPQGPMGMNQQGQNRFGVGLARPMPQNTQVS